MSHPYTPVCKEIASPGIRQRREIEYGPEARPQTLRMLANYLEFFVDTSCVPHGDFDTTAYTQRAYEYTFKDEIDTNGNELKTEIYVEVTTAKKKRDPHYPAGLAMGYSIWMWHEDTNSEIIAADEFRLREYRDGGQSLSILSRRDSSEAYFLPGTRGVVSDFDWRKAHEYEAKLLLSDLSDLALPGQDPYGAKNNKVL